MPDVFATITDATPEIIAGIRTVLELRAAEPQQQAMLHTYLTVRCSIPSVARSAISRTSP